MAHVVRSLLFRQPFFVGLALYIPTVTHLQNFWIKCSTETFRCFAWLGGSISDKNTAINRLQWHLLWLKFVRIRPALKGRGPRNHWLYVFFGWCNKSDQIFCSYLFFFHHEAFRDHQKATQDVLISNFLVGVTRIFFVRTATNPQWDPSSTTSFWGSAKLPLTSFAGGEGAGSGSVRPEFARAEKPRPISWLGFCRSKKLPLATGIRNYWGGEFSVVGLVWWCGFEEISIWIMYIYI